MAFVSYSGKQPLFSQPIICFEGLPPRCNTRLRQHALGVRLVPYGNAKLEQPVNASLVDNLREQLDVKWKVLFLEVFL